MNLKRYIGDGVYADFDGYAIVLTTEDGISITNTIYIEPEVLLALEKYVADLKRLGKSDDDPSVQAEQEAQS